MIGFSLCSRTVYLPRIPLFYDFLPLIRFFFSYRKGENRMQKDPDRNGLKSMALMSTILAQLAGTTLMGIFSGRWLDARWGTEPLFLVIGLLLGLTAGIYSMFLSLNHFFSGD